MIKANSLDNEAMNHLLDVTTRFEERQHATPFFWHIHKAGGTALHDYLSSCLNMTVASEVGVLEGHDQDQELSPVIIKEHTFINVDTTTENGIERAEKLGFQNMLDAVDVVISPLVLPAAKHLFSTSKKGMAFVMMRHPVDRLISLYYYLKKATWEPTYKEEWASMTLMEYIESDHVESNWMVRFLVGKPEGLIDEHDLEEAKRILLEKFWVGLQSNMVESLKRFGFLFDWKAHQKWNSCFADFEAGKNRANSNSEKGQIDQNSEEWVMLREINELDLKLFTFARHVYEAQGSIYFPQFKANTR